MNQEYNAADPCRYQRGYRETIASVNRGIVVCEETVPFSGNLSKQKGSGGYLKGKEEGRFNFSNEIFVLRTCCRFIVD